MQDTQEITQNNLDHYLKNLSLFAFDIDKESRIILGIIAKNGPVTETKITSLGKRRTILSRDIIRRRLLITDLSSDFLSVKTGKKIGNLQGKRERKYSLTLKGLLASLSEISIGKNFWIKNYNKMIENISSKVTSELFLRHIYFAIISFLILHSNRKGLLTKYSNIEEDFEENYSYDAFEQITEKTQIRRINKEYRKLFVDYSIQFFISTDLIGEVLERTLKISLFPASKKQNDYWHYDEILECFFRSWGRTIFLSLDKSPQKTLEKFLKIPQEERDNEYGFEDALGDEKWDSIRFMGVDEFEKIKSQLELDTVDVEYKQKINHEPTLTRI